MLSPRLLVLLVTVGAALVAASAAGAPRSGASPVVRGVPDSNPVWSPDNRRIAFERQTTRGETSSWVARPNGRGAHRVSRFAPLWSPDGRRMAILEDGKLWLASGDGSGKGRVGSAFWGAWSPDGSLFAFAGGEGLHVVKRDGTGARRLPIDVPTCPNCASTEYEPAWSPDGKSLAFVHSDIPPLSKGTSSVWAADIDGGNLRRISESWVAESPAWSPSGRLIAYLLFDNFEDDPYLHVSYADASHDRRYGLAYEYRFSWAPGRDVLAFEAARPPKRLYLVHPDREVITIRGASAPSWSPDGQMIALERRGGIQVVDTRGLTRRRLARGRQPAWSADGKMIAYAGVGCGERQGIQTVAPSGQGRRRITNFCFIPASARSELLRGTPGTDLVLAGSGDDLILVRDQRRDVVKCGPGRDTVRADRADRLTACEVVRLGR